MQQPYLPKPSVISHVSALLIIAAVLYFGRTLLVPMSYGLFIAIVLYPVCRWLEKHRCPRSVAIAAPAAAGGIIWGVSGTILFIPFAGVLKIILDHIPGWRVYNILLGTDKPDNVQ